MEIRSKNYSGATFPEKQKIKRHYVSRLAFNFSFMTKEKKYNFDYKKINHKVKSKLIERILSLSEDDKVIILNRSKDQGFERLPEKDVNLRINPDFKSSGRYDICADGYWIFRLNRLGRVIGKMDDNIFYVLAIDVDFDMYNHG